MEVTAKLNYLRIAPRKVRLVVDLIKGKKIGEARAILSFAQKRAATPLLKLLDSAVANAKHNFQLEESNLYISKIIVNEGPKLKRWRARARGRAYEIQKKTSHIFLFLEELVKKPQKKRVKKRVKKTEKIKKKEKVLKPKEEKKETKIGPEKPRFEKRFEIRKPKIEKGLKRVFRRKAF